MSPSATRNVHFNEKITPPVIDFCVASLEKPNFRGTDVTIKRLTPYLRIVTSRSVDVITSMAAMNRSAMIDTPKNR